MTPANATRFTFDLDLATGRRMADPVRTVRADEADALVAAARAQAYREGLEEGANAAQAKAADALAKAAGALAAEAGTYVEGMETQRADLVGEATALSLAIGRKLAGHLIARQPAGELEALISEALTNLDHAPHLVIRCHPDLADTLKSAAEERMRTSGFAGRLVVMGDPEIGLGDGRLEWVDGGLVRDQNAILDTIDEKITAYLAARGVAATTEPD